MAIIKNSFVYFLYILLFTRTELCSKQHVNLQTITIKYLKFKLKPHSYGKFQVNQKISIDSVEMLTK